MKLYAKNRSDSITTRLKKRSLKICTTPIRYVEFFADFKKVEPSFLDSNLNGLLMIFIATLLSQYTRPLN